MTIAGFYMQETYYQIMKCLWDLGLSEREAKVYMAMLANRNATATELQKHSGIPQSKIYEVIDGLVRRGFCIERKTGRKKTFEVVNPEIALDSSFKELKNRLENSLNVQKKLAQLYTSTKKVSDPSEYIEVLRGNDNIHHRYCQLVRNTCKELLGFNRRPYACDTSKKACEQRIVQGKIAERGVISRWVCELVMPDDEWLIESLRELKDNNQDIRVAEKLPLKMMIFDRELLLVADEPEPFSQPGDLTMSVIKQGTIVNAFLAMFEYFWENSIDFVIWEKMRIPINV